MGNSSSNVKKIVSTNRDAISFSGLHWTTIPSFIKYKIDFKLVTIFEAEDNQLSNIPADVAQLTNLVTLNFSRNNIVRFSTPPLPHLKKLNLGFNPLEELPDDLELAPSLELVICYKCNLRNLPIACLQKMVNLSVMVNGNRLHIGYDHIPHDVSLRLQGINDQRVPSVILEDFLYLGSVASAQEWAELERFQIRHIVCMVNMFELPFVGKVTYKTIQIDDIEIADIKQYFETINQFITSVKNAGGRVLVHCAAGVSRSASAVLAYLMNSQRMTYSQAKEYVMHRRPCICPNDGFERQLLEYDEFLRQRMNG